MQTEFTKQIDVDGFRYIISHPDPERAYFMGIELGKIIAEPIAIIGASTEKNAVFDAMKTLLLKLDPAKSFDLFKRALRTVEVQGSVDGEKKGKFLLDENNIKIHFQGRHGSLVKVAVEALMFQQEDFSRAIKDVIAMVTNKG